MMGIYARLGRWNNHAGWILLTWPCIWGLILSDYTLTYVAMPLDLLTSVSIPPMLWTLNVVLLSIVFAFAAFLARSVGCVWNDILDRRLDRLVERTKDRPLASGALSLTQALVFAGGMLLILALWVTEFLPMRALLAAALAFPLVVLYPFIKWTFLWPQIWLGFTFSWGVWVGWVSGINMLQDPIVETANAIYPMLSTPLLIYLMSICWVIGYDTIYATQDRHDDRRLGVRSLATAFPNPKIPVIGSYFLCVLSLISALLSINLAWTSLLWCLPFAMHLVWQCWRWDVNNARSSWKMFRSNTIAGGLLTAGLFGAVLTTIS